MGGGITGILTARELLLSGWEVTLLEAQHVGSGSSSRTAAGIRQQFSTPGTVRGMRYAVDFYEAFADEVEGGQSPIVQNGYLFLHAEPQAWAEAKRIMAVQRSAGLAEVEALESDDLIQRFPWVSRDAAIGATYCPTDGFLLPHLVYNEGARRVRELGGTIVQLAPVTGAEVVGDRIVSVQTPKGRFAGDLFFDCTNVWTRRLSAVLGAVELQVDPLKRYLWFIDRDGPMTAQTLGSMPLTITPGGIYCRPENPQTLLMGKKHDTRPELDFTYEDQDLIEPDFGHTSGVDAVPFELWMELAAALPDVGEFGGISATTCGYYGSTPDHNPFLGYDPQRANLVHLVGFSGHGAMMGPFTARVGCELAEAGHDLDHMDLEGVEVPLDAFHVGRDHHHAEAMVI